MKKSEMIQKVAERFGLEDNEVLVNAIIDFVIENGMLPPPLEFKMAGKTIRDVGWEDE